MVRWCRVLSLTLLTLSLAACGGSSGSSDSDDSDEEATTRVIGDTPVDGVIDSADMQEQLFAFAAPADGVYNVLLSWPGAGSDLDLFITDGDDSYFTLSANGTTESINVALSTGDILAIAVNAFLTAGPQAFTISAAATTQPAHFPGHVESEPNEDPATNGNVIGLGQASGIVHVTSDQDDSFVYVAPEAGTYTVLLTWVNTVHDLDLFIGWDTGAANSIQVGTEFESITQALNADEQLRVLVTSAFDLSGVPVSYNLTIEAQ